jgi:hypothetical protein
MTEVTKDAADFANLHEAEELLSMQIDDLKGEQIDPDNEPDLYLPLSAAKAIHKALSDQAAALAALRSEVERLREAIQWLADDPDLPRPFGTYLRDTLALTPEQGHE